MRLERIRNNVRSLNLSRGLLLLSLSSSLPHRLRPNHSYSRVPPNLASVVPTRCSPPPLKSLSFRPSNRTRPSAPPPTSCPLSLVSKDRPAASSRGLQAPSTNRGPGSEAEIELW